MGGREGSRGYLYQAIVCVLDSLSTADWETVQIEPDQEKEKVDILWEYKNQRKKVTQVKSSKNNFNKIQIIGWLKELINDYHDADVYTLTLVGNCDSPTKKFINKIEKGDVSEIPDIVDRIKGNLVVGLESYDINMLESRIAILILKFLNDNGYTVTSYILEMMSGGIIFYLSKLGADGQRITRTDFEKKLLEWTRFNFPEILDGEFKGVSLEIAFYYHNIEDFSKKIEGIKLDYLTNNENISKEKEDLKKLIDELNDINLPSEERKVFVNTHDKLLHDMMSPKTMDMIKKISIAASAELSNKEKNELRMISQKLLGIDLADEFFFIGNLKNPIFNPKIPFLSSSNKRNGNEIELKKGEKIDEFAAKLRLLDSIIKTLEFIRKFYDIPLVLRNIGRKFDEKIKVKLKIPKAVKILMPDDFVIPSNLTVIRMLTGERGTLAKLLKHRKDSKVAEYKNFISSPTVSIPPSLFSNYEEQKNEAINDFKSYLRRLFNFELYLDDEEETIIEYNFRELNAKENIGFPSYILVDSKESFCIRYEITSKNLTDIITGELLFEIKNQIMATKNN